MTHKTSSLRARLHQAGIAINENDTQASPPIPWFVRVLQAFSGWLAALFLLGFIALGAVFVVESTLASLSLGVVMLGAAFVLLRVTRSDVTEHLALAISLAGQLLVAWALVNVWEGSTYPFWALLGWSLFGLQGVLALVMPSQAHRGFSAFAASVALYMALAASAMASAASGLVLLALTVLWVNEFRWPSRIHNLQAWGIGLLVGLLVIQGLAHTGQSLSLFDEQTGGTWGGLTPWLNAALVALALLLLFRSVFQNPCSFRGRWAAYACAVALVIVSFHTPSVGQGAVVMLLGFAIGHRLLLGAGVLSLLLGIGSYYYWLESTLLMKSLTLLGLGVLLLLLRWALRRWLSSAMAKPNDGGSNRDV